MPLGRWAAGPLGRWAAGPLGRWAAAAGPLGRWAAGPLGRWAAGPLGRWAAGPESVGGIPVNVNGVAMSAAVSKTPRLTARSRALNQRLNRGRDVTQPAYRKDSMLIVNFFV